jgi:hypothetical protein
MTDQTTALAPVEAMPLPAMSGAQLVESITLYRGLTREIDHALPDTRVEIAGTAYRTKEFYRAIGLAFDLTVELVDEREHERGAFADGRANFGYLVLMRATTRTGRSALGDGACHAIEKAEAFKCPHPQPGSDWKRLHYPADTCPDYDPAFAWATLPVEATDHNVRATAYTRATNRAIANLVAFGEVSAEEMQRGPDTTREPGGTSRPQQRAQPARAVPISEAQLKRMWVIAKQHGWTEQETKSVYHRHGFEHAEQITRDKYDVIIFELEAGVQGGTR